MSPHPFILCGATGRTGNAVAHAIQAHPEVALVACVAPSLANGETPTRSIPAGIAGYSSLEAALDEAPASAVVVDLSHADPAREHVKSALTHGHHLVLGATGLADSELAAWGEEFAGAGLGLLEVPNFSLGAVISMRIAAEIAHHFPSVEIVELHHDTKRDSPSGTAVRAAQRIARARAQVEPPSGVRQQEGRGVLVDGVPVHALRLPGATAHQEVIFGAPGELLTIRHDAIDRACYAAGVARSVVGVSSLRGRHIGLEHVL